MAHSKMCAAVIAAAVIVMPSPAWGTHYCCQSSGCEVSCKYGGFSACGNTPHDCSDCGSCNDCSQCDGHCTNCQSESGAVSWNAQHSCGPNEVYTGGATATLHGNCRHVITCGHGEYLSEPTTSTNPGRCSRLTVCQTGEYQSHAPTYSTDRQCTAVTPCDAGVNYQTGLPTATSNTRCTRVKNCTLGGTYQPPDGAPTATTDRVCVNVSRNCGPNTFYTPSGAPTVTSNRVCTPVHQCILNSTWAVEPATASSQTVCIPVTNCTASGHGIASPATVTSDAVCETTATTERLSSGATVGVAIGAFLALILLAVISLYTFRKESSKHSDAMERALSLTGSLSERMELMQSAWEIPWEHVQLLSKLAEGSFGEVWSATYSNMKVAVKLLKRSAGVDAYTDDPAYQTALAQLEHEQNETFRAECEMLQLIRHPHLIIFFGAGVADDGRSFMVTELMPGGSLRAALLDKTRDIAWSTRSEIAKQIALGMQHLHSLGMVHRDLKSDNVLLDNDFNAKVGDFGTARLVTASSSRTRRTTETTMGAPSASVTQGVGTPLWMAPEVFTGRVTMYGPKVDVYSYAIIMWELATRQRPWSELDHLSRFQFIQALTEKLLAGKRPPLPDGFAEEHITYARVMRRAWGTAPEGRPTFDMIVVDLSSDEPAVMATAPKSAGRVGDADNDLNEPLLPPE